MKSCLAWGRLFFAALSLLTLFNACSPDNDGALGMPATASFTVSPVAGVANTYALTSTSQNAFGYLWDKGTGRFERGDANDTAYFATAGTYQINLKAFGRGGYDSSSQSVTVESDDIQNNETFKALTAHSWKLDATPGANAIIVGTEGNPAQYFPGGPIDACQADDVYTFAADLTLTYAANGATFNGSNIAPNFSCGNDRSYQDVKISFAPGAAGEGIATITLPGNVPDQFIGVTDVSSNNYRIISIDESTMVLRSGTSSQTVHQFKFVAQ